LLGSDRTAEEAAARRPPLLQRFCFVLEYDAGQVEVTRLSSRGLATT
jgi:hypothetical protein